LRNNLEKLISYGSGVVGALTTTGAGFMVAGPLGALATSSLAPLVQGLFEDTATEFLNRQLSKREQGRVADGLSFALKLIDERLNKGEQPRLDGFFGETPQKGSDAEILLEGVIKCKSEYEKQKLVHIASLFANVAFESDISASIANYFLSVIGLLTYQQICVLSLVQQSNELGFDTLLLDEPKGTLPHQTGLRCQIEALQDFGVHLLSHNGTPYYRLSDISRGVNTNFPKTAYFLSDMGKQFFGICRLDLVPRRYLEDLVQQFGPD
jgi:hypothetical protein